MGDFDYTYPIIHNKVAPPRYVTPILRRGRLLDWLHANANCRAVVLAADAGYGKTTLLWQWEREVTFPIYWYKLDPNDRDWSLHITYLVEAIRHRHPGFGKRTTSMLRQLGGPRTSRPGVAAYLLSEMHDRLSEPCTFIVDDWQDVASVTEVRGLWNQILRDAPSTCRFVFASRSKPRLQFARFTTHGGYAQIGTDELRFTDDEIDRLFRDIYHDPLDPTELAELERRTEGWAASLQLVEVSLRERTTPEARRAFIESITGESDSDLFAFLAEEVLDRQTERTRNFLLSTSILSQITPELAERLTGIQDGSHELADLEQRGLFTYRLDEARYRYHRLFREFLEDRLRAERSDAEVAGLHIHAASYFETTAQWPEAIHHYLKAGLQRQAARLIARYGEDVVSEGRLGMVDEWLSQLPGRTVKENARLSLLQGEALGMRGDWDGALVALNRARDFFKRKGDRRVEALACLKLSTVHQNLGRLEECASLAGEGLELAPDDAKVTRLRLQGNVAVTATWLDRTLQDAAQACRRVAVEAIAMGLDHYAAIAHHNLGVLLRDMGRVSDSATSLEEARRTWAEGPENPYGDNCELVLTHLLLGKSALAASLAGEGIRRTRPWPRPHAEAWLGQAAVLIDGGQFAEAADLVLSLAPRQRLLGSAAALAYVLYFDALYLLGGDLARVADESVPLEASTFDPRLAPLVQAAAAIASHSSGTCACAAARVVIRHWREKGAVLPAAVADVKLGVVHGQWRTDTANALSAAASLGILPSLRHWTRHLVPVATQIRKGSIEVLMKLFEADPEAWRTALVRQLPTLEGADRNAALIAITQHANRSTVGLLATVGGADVAEARKLLAMQQAPRIFIRTFGSLEIHRGGWSARPVTLDKRRLRLLLGLLVAYANRTLTREQVLDLLWPDSDPAAAVNSLNQAVFQLRRLLDPQYKDGQSAPYLISTPDTIQLNADLVRTDLAEFRRNAKRLGSATAPADRMSAAEELVTLVRGEHLTDVRYEDWAAQAQMKVHAEVRETLLPIARGETLAVSAGLSLRAATALVAVDELDEAANIALARQLSQAGRRSAARDVIFRLARQIDQQFEEPPSEELSRTMQELGVNSK